jgi:anti-sigma factor RsiW
MSCSPFDLRDYFLKELPDPERKQVEIHARTCAVCREELERLQMTEAALVSLRDEEIPQRLAFVSDKIFEPSGLRRAWAAFWGSAAKLGFASAAMLSVALVVFSLAPRGHSLAAAASISPAQLQQQVDAAQINAIVDRAVAASESKLERRIAEIQQENRKERQELVRWADSLVDYSRRNELMFERSSYGARQ